MQLDGVYLLLEQWRTVRALLDYEIANTNAISWQLPKGLKETNARKILAYQQA